MTNLIALAERCEAAEPSEQDALLDEAYAAVFGKVSYWHSVYGDGPEEKALGRRFSAFLSCGAFINAAEMLLLEWWNWGVGALDLRARTARRRVRLSGRNVCNLSVSNPIANTHTHR